VGEPLRENFEDKPVDVVVEHCVNYCNKYCIENPCRNFTNRSETNCHRKSTRCELSYSLFRGLRRTSSLSTFLKTTLEKMQFLEEPRLEVVFYGESAEDFGYHVKNYLVARNQGQVL